MFLISLIFGSCYKFSDKTLHYTFIQDVHGSLKSFNLSEVTFYVINRNEIVLNLNVHGCLGIIKKAF